MSKPTMVSIRSGPHADGYTFCVDGNESEKFTCRYDGINVKLSIFVRGTRVTEVLNLVHGLFHKDSNFKKQLFREYSYIKPQNLKSIAFESTTGYKFVIKADSNVDEYMRQYYRFYNYEVHDSDTEDEIVARHREKMKKFHAQFLDYKK